MKHSIVSIAALAALSLCSCSRDKTADRVERAADRSHDAAYRAAEGIRTNDDARDARRSVANALEQAAEKLRSED